MSKKANIESIGGNRPKPPAPQAEQQGLYPLGSDAATGWPRFMLMPDRTIYITAPEEIVRRGMAAQVPGDAPKPAEP